MQAGAAKGLVLVTGASSGLGEAFARAYAAKGRDLALVARRADRLEALAAELKQAHGVSSLVIPADLAVWDAHKPILERVADAGLWVETLVNNAGFGIPQDYADTPWERQRDFLMTLVTSACGLAHGAVPRMIAERRGAIVNVASMAGLSPGGAGHTLYPAAKAFAIKFSQSLDAELRDKGIKVTAVCPGFTLTEFAEASGTQHLMDKAPRRFWQTAEEVVATTLKANAAGRVVVVPGLHNKVAAAAMRYLPDSWTRAAIARGGAKYRIEKKE
jgi:hypothetical protein